LDNITPENTTESSINHIINQLNIIYINAAKTTVDKSTGGRKRIPKSNKNSNPWFTNACLKPRRQFRNSKVYYFRKLLEYARKIYKDNEKCRKRFFIKNNYYTETKSVNISQKYKIIIKKNIGK
jgi:hypothetical protein